MISTITTIVSYYVLGGAGCSSKSSRKNDRRRRKMSGMDEEDWWSNLYLCVSQMRIGPGPQPAFPPKHPNSLVKHMHEAHNTPRACVRACPCAHAQLCPLSQDEGHHSDASSGWAIACAGSDRELEVLLSPYHGPSGAGPGSMPLSRQTSGEPSAFPSLEPRPECAHCVGGGGHSQQALSARKYLVRIVHVPQ